MATLIATNACGQNGSSAVGISPQSLESVAEHDALVQAFAAPPLSARLRCYWWWLNGHVTVESIDHDLNEMKDKGYGGVLLVDANGADGEHNNPVPAGPTFGSPAWTVLFLHAVETAHKLGLEITLTITSGWDLGAPFIEPKDAIKILTWSRTITNNDGKTIVPEPSPKHPFYERIAVLAYPLRHGLNLAGESGDQRAPRANLRQKAALAETGGSMPRSDDLLFDITGTAGEEDANVSEVVDVTQFVDSKGVLHWKAPSLGAWEVLNIGYTNSGAKLSPGSGAWQGLSLDTLSPAALDMYWDKQVVPLLDQAKPYLGNTIKYVTTDSWEMGGMNWTEKFREEFRRRRGYDPVSYLPIVAGRILDSRKVSDEFLNDLRRTVADLINLHFDTMAERAAHFGLGVQCESGGPHGEPIDALETFRNSAVPQTEFWGMSKVHRSNPPDRYFVKEASSAAHIYGKPIVAAEGETSMGNHWTESIGMNLKPSFDMALTEGLNRLVWHQFASSPVEMGLPGQEYFAGTYLNTKVTWWQEAGAFTAYLNRSQFLMQQGLPVADVLYYYGDQVPNFVRLKTDDPAGVLPGYDYDVTDTEALTGRMVVDGGGLRSSEGIRYRMLVLPASRIMPQSALEFVEHYLKNGGVVVGERPLRSQGIVPGAEETNYQHLADSLWRECEASSGKQAHVGKGTLFCITKATPALHSIGMVPDFEATSAAIDFAHRRTTQADIYFVRNGNPEPITTDLTFRVGDRQPAIFDPVTGRVTPVMSFLSTADGRTKLTYAMAPYEAFFVVFQHPVSRIHATEVTRSGEVVPLSDDTMVEQDRGLLSLRTATPGAYAVNFADGRTSAVTIEAMRSENPIDKWTLDFPAGWGAPLHVDVPALKSWTEFSEPGVRYFSGTATYRTTISIDAKQLLPGNELWLNLGEVHEVARIRVNGTELTPLWKNPFSARIDSLVHAGDNKLEIDITNLWPNRLIGDAQPGVTRHYTSTNIKAFTASSPLLPSGLLGPVQLESVYVSPVAPPKDVKSGEKAAVR